MAAVLLSGCALFRRTDPAARTPPPSPTRSEETTAARGTGRVTERTAEAQPGDRRVPERTDAGAGSPRRLASQRLVEEGKGFRIAGRDAEAAERFQAALRLDGSNGVAHFYLAQLAADAGRWTEAAGYYEQAAALLRGREEYREPLGDLAGRIAERR